MEKKIVKITNKRIIDYNLKMYGNLVQRQNPQQRRQKLVNSLASVSNVQVVKLRNSSVEFHKDFILYFYCIFSIRKGRNKGWCKISTKIVIDNL